jgi:hypothetical protein
VGYGTDAFITGSGASPKAVTIFDGIRSYRAVSPIPAQDAFPDRFLKITPALSGRPRLPGQRPLYGAPSPRRTRLTPDVTDRVQHVDAQHAGACELPVVGSVPPTASL